LVFGPSLEYPELALGDELVLLGDPELGQLPE
jgi:hypothetical protein